MQTTDTRLEAQPDPGLVLFVVVHGKPWTLHRWASEFVEEHISSIGEALAWEEAIAGPVEGVWVAELGLVDDGPGDWPGAREYSIQASAVRMPTAEEWSRFVAGEYVWDGEIPEAQR